MSCHISNLINCTSCRRSSNCSDQKNNSITFTCNCNSRRNNNSMREKAGWS